jgi:hypothetical protein
MHGRASTQHLPLLTTIVQTYSIKVNLPAEYHWFVLLFSGRLLFKMRQHNMFERKQLTLP